MKKLLISLFTISALVACHKDNADNDNDKIKADRTVLIYVSGENSLYDFIDEELGEMATGTMTIGDNNLLVYVDRGSSSEIPWLARIKEGEISDSVSIADMSISTKDEYASDPKVMEAVIRYAFNKFPSKNSDYGLVLWGHASGWLIQDSIPANYMARKKAYGVDNGSNTSSDTGKWLNIPMMAKMLSKLPHLTFIFADCCNFMCLESAYELRNVTDYIIGSPAEIPGVGAPYNTVVPAMFEKTTFHTSIVDRYYAQHDGGYDVPLSVIKTSEMDNMASATRSILLATRDKFGDDYPDMQGIIHYYNPSWSFRPENSVFYDADNFFLKYASEADYAPWKQALDHVVIYKKKATEWMTNRRWSTHYADFTVTDENYGGVSMFIPQSPFNGDYSEYNKNIKKMAWYYAAGYSDIGW